MSKLVKIVLMVIVAAGVLNVTGAPRRRSRPTPQQPAQPSAPAADPLDGVLKHIRDSEFRGTGTLQRWTYSFKVVRVISDSEGIFEVFCRNEIYASRERLDENRSGGYVYVKGFDLSDKADGDVIYLKKGMTVWRVGVYRTKRRSLPKYTTDRREAEEYARTHRKK